MSENYCPSCGLQKSYGRTLAYYPDGPDLNKNICSKCGQTLISADATIATLQRENEALRKKLSAEEEDHAQLQARCYEGFPSASDGIFDELSALRAELARKEAALKEAGLALHHCEGELSAVGHRGTVDANNVKNFSAEARAAIWRIEAALQPKEPPCQTA